MTRCISAIICALLLMGNSFGFPITLQEWPPSDKTRSSEKPNDDEEQAKIAADCATSGRPKPELEKNMAKNSLLCGKAISLPKPSYPAEAKEKRIAGVVAIEIVIDERGRVIWARAIEGHELLQEAAIKAACNARYSPMEISGARSQGPWRNHLQFRQGVISILKLRRLSFQYIV